MAEFTFAPLESPVAARPAAAVPSSVHAAQAEAGLVRAAAHAEGMEAGRAEALSRVAPAVAALEQGLVEARAHGQTVAARLESEAVELGFAVAEKILGAAVAADSEVVLEAVRGALRGLVERERVTLLVNPADLELVRGASEELRVALGGIEHCDVLAERRVARGGAIVRYAEGQVDACVETKLERARELVAEALGGPDPA